MTQNFPDDMIELADDPRIPLAQKVCITAAAAASLLAYSANPVHDLVNNDLYSEIYSSGLITKVWPVEGYDTPMILAWSGFLNTSFLAIRGTVTSSDWLETNLQAAPELHPVHNVAIHGGFYNRAAKLPIELITLFMRDRKRTVVCGHSLG